MVEVDGLMLAVNRVFVPVSGATVPPPTTTQSTVVAGSVETVTVSPIPKVVRVLSAGTVATVSDFSVTAVVAVGPIVIESGAHSRVAVAVKVQEYVPG
jgi:hypothetical protein